MMKNMRRRTRTRSLGRSRAMTRRPSSSQRRKGTPREASWWKNKKLGNKKRHDKKTKLFPKKKGHTKRSFLVEKQEWVADVSSSEDSNDANIAKSPGTTLGSALYHHVLFLIYPRITLQCFKITIFY